MTLAETALAIAVLLATPGPTNTLLAIAGAERGFWRAARVIPVEVASYLVTVVPLAVAGTGLLGAAPSAGAALSLVAAVWVMWLAAGLWRSPARGAMPSVTARRVAVTTMLNPKALVFGLVLVPSPEAGRLAANLLTFVALVVVAAAAWAGLGALARRPGPMVAAPSRAWRRAAALWLAALGAWLVWRALSA